MSSYAVYSIKGGVGKTTISVQLAKSLQFMYVSNDPHAGAQNLFEENEGFLIPEEIEEIPFENGLVFDFGGFKDLRIKSVLAQCEKVIVPTLTSVLDVQSTLSILKDINEVNKNVVIVINRIKPDYSNKNKFAKPESLEEYLRGELKRNNVEFDTLEFVYLKESALLEDCLFDCKSVFEKVGEDKFRKHIYRVVLEDIETLNKKVTTAGVN